MLVQNILFARQLIQFEVSCQVLCMGDKFLCHSVESWIYFYLVVVVAM